MTRRAKMMKVLQYSCRLHDACWQDVLAGERYVNCIAAKAETIRLLLQEGHDRRRIAEFFNMSVWNVGYYDPMSGRRRQSRAFERAQHHFTAAE